MVTQVLIWEFNFLANSYGEITVVLDPLPFSQEKVAHIHNKCIFQKFENGCMVLFPCRFTNRSHTNEVFIMYQAPSVYILSSIFFSFSLEL